MIILDTEVIVKKNQPFQEKEKANARERVVKTINKISKVVIQKNARIQKDNKKINIGAISSDRYRLLSSKIN